MPAGDKTEKPTAKRLREARREGRTPRTPELGTWLGLLVASWLLQVTGRHTVTVFQQLFAQVPEVAADPTGERATALLVSGLSGLLSAAAPFALGMLAVGLTANAAQGGVRLSLRAARPKFSHLNPLNGLKRMFGPQAAWQAAKSLLKVCLLAVLCWLDISTAVRELSQPGPMATGDVVGLVLSTVLALVRQVAGAGLVLAVADYAWTRRTFRKSLMMTKQEVKEEGKQSEAPPEIKRAIRRRQFTLARNRMIRDVAGADVVLVNPTHYAVALVYQRGTGAPRVVAKGVGEVAARIREAATEHRVPIVHDPPLARAVYAACDLGAEIPAELYGAVARVLAFLYALRARGRSTAGVHRATSMPRTA